MHKQSNLNLVVHHEHGSGAEQRTHAHSTRVHGSRCTSSARRRGAGSSSAGRLVVDRRRCRGLARRERSLGHSRGVGEAGLALVTRGVGNGRVGGVQDPVVLLAILIELRHQAPSYLLIDDVHDTVGDQDIGNRHAGVVHKDATLVANGDGKVGAV